MNPGGRPRPARPELASVTLARVTDCTRPVLPRDMSMPSQSAMIVSLKSGSAL